MSKKMVSYTQCVLEMKTDTGKLIDTRWIPTFLAKLGKSLEIKKDGVWCENWVVASVGATKDSEYIEVHKDDYKNQAKASDISRAPKSIFKDLK